MFLSKLRRCLGGKLFNVSNVVPVVCGLSVSGDVCGFHTTSQNYGFDKYSLKRNRADYRKQNKTMEKVYKRPAGVPIFELDPLGKEDAPVQQTNARQDALSSIVFDAMNGLLTSQDVDEELANLIEITEVQMSQGLKTAVIYWTTVEGMEDRAEELLTQNGDMLRRMFPAHHQMTRSPNIQFKKDKKLEYIAKVNELLEKADYGEGYTPEGHGLIFPTDIKKLEKKIFIDSEVSPQDSLYEETSQHNAQSGVETDKIETQD